ncbi:hypothetical protein B857_01192 [Solibacillus isronensis B3W22]|uniref:Uncharacterized protein n=1 Tax=Solibacillus isronensis B3W22 TaxID=1224748 RepID=K1KP63_9BACL|nr:hypothetical protein SOLI23_05325 [Solibacillus silvestris]EKB45920.1 hypothetical protein B857_01192 [Solibacillus isronensis B3W22]
MFFKKMTDIEKRNSKKAAQFGFFFYSVTLLTHSIYSYINNAVLNSSFYILMAGLVIFFICEFIFNKKR